MLRCFVAVEVTAPLLLRTLEGAQLALRRAFGQPDQVKWVPAHQFHLTLKFLGEISEEAAVRAMAALERAAHGVAPFVASVEGLGCFPSLSRPSVLVAGLAEGASEMKALAGAVERELGARGFAAERRPFTPHLTLGRVRRGGRVPPAVPRLIGAQPRQEFGQWHVERVVLMQSELTPSGPVYSVYGSVPLREEKR